MNKQERQSMIEKLVRENKVYRQKQLVDLLRKVGADVTQATVSRDIKEMQLMKTPDDAGNYCYAVPKEQLSNTKNELIRKLHEVFVFANHNDKLCVIKVLPGNGPIISGLVEKMNFPGFFAALNDDDTVMIFAQTVAAAENIYQEIIDLTD